MFSMQSMFARAPAVLIGPESGPLAEGRAYIDHVDTDVFGGSGIAGDPAALIETAAHPGVSRGWHLVDDAVTYRIREVRRIDDGDLTELALEVVT